MTMVNITGWERYSVTNDGQVWDGKRQTWLTPSNNGTGYFQVRLNSGKGIKSFYVHRLVAAAFIGPCPSGMWVNHKDFDRSNNSIDNLEYLSREDNAARGERVNRAKLTESQVRQIRKEVALGATHRSVAEKYGMARTGITAIIRGRTWRRIA